MSWGPGGVISDPGDGTRPACILYLVTALSVALGETPPKALISLPLTLVSSVLIIFMCEPVLLAPWGNPVGLEL